MGVFKRGYKAVEEEKVRQDEIREKMKSNIFRFFLQGDGSEAEIRFLTEEPITFYEHTLKKFKNGKEMYDSVLCTGKDCPLCKDGDRSSFKGAYLIIDKRPFEYTDTKTNKKVKGTSQIRLYVAGNKILSTLDRLSSKHGLTDRDYTIVRLGSGTSTTYTFERGDESPVTSKEIKALLSDALKEQYDGTEDSLYTIVENAVMGTAPADTSSRDDDDDDDDAPPARRGTVSIDEDDDEEYEAPAKKPLFKAGAKKKPVNSSFKRK